MLTQTRMITRNTTERRVKDRRQVDFEFGSTQWIEHMKKNYVAWPKFDRRKMTRRDGERRLENRSQQGKHSTQEYSSDLLTEEEWLYFNHLFMNDSEK